MPKQDSIKKVLVIGSGAIVIGQAAEFDYSGAQACTALKEEGIDVVLINNNPATIMTDKTIANTVYFEPLTAESVAAILEKERPDGLLATVGGQTGLNLAMELTDKGILEQYDVKLLGTNIDSIKQAEDRDAFRSLMNALNEPVPESDIIYSIDQALTFAKSVGYPVIVRPAYTLGGFGGGIAEVEEDFINLVKQGLSASPIHQCLVEKSIAGYKEVEYEVMRDAAGTCITICNMENLDPVGVHTGDSIVVAPSQTLHDKEYHMLRTASIKIIEALGIVGGCNIQFALHPVTSEYFLIEVNPRVSRSSALASKATGYPIARLATKLAVGYSLHELKNPVTGTTFASFEPALDYVTVKIPRWPFDQFTEAHRKLGTQMKATGEVMAIERNMEAAFQKAIRSLDIKLEGFRLPALADESDESLKYLAVNPDDRRLFVLIELFMRGYSLKELQEATGISPYFLSVLQKIVSMKKELKEFTWTEITKERLNHAKKHGFSDADLAKLWRVPAQLIRDQRKKWGITPSYRMVDTCAAEFEAKSNYFYSTWSGTSDERSSSAKKVAVIGSGPIRIGQGIEFDYCCVHSVIALQKLGYEAIMINNNPETVSTDYEVADALYFEPLTTEDILNVLDFEGIDQVIVQFGGQTSINVAKSLEAAGITILGSTSEILDQMEDRDRFYSFLESIKLPVIPGFTANQPAEIWQAVASIGYPILLRPSYVIGGSGMVKLNTEQELDDFLASAQIEYPVLVDRFIEGKEVEVDVLTDGENSWISAVFEHIEGTGVHSGDSISITPPLNLPAKMLDYVCSVSKHIAKNMSFKGLFNIQFVCQKDGLYVIEINPRASRTAPIASKVTDVPLVQHATALMLGKTFDELNIMGSFNGQRKFTVKAPVFSHVKLPDLSPALSPVMTSTGEVIASHHDPNIAMYKALTGASQQLANLWKESGSIFIEAASWSKIDVKAWESYGFTVLSSSSLSFDEWMEREDKKVYINLHTDAAAKNEKKAAIHRLHVWTRLETAEAYLGTLGQSTLLQKGVLA
ncbi:carbamoyl phosphate synthase large subunit [Jeotgalibacillus proteolyticus]|uniref:Carbamoyl phosphate synthase large chain n=1 Tax=Jeotgalibacillus proteolyticus TaxID=2082395 RepID=A0A2S5G9U0_9BACL|nr:carbamoyl phosphate synthase large subunit [Jeotgalibacillus proteolyticus]PPA69787.1 carbamoyl-phosphate synthase large subunit [Jeotgalibacillus proteolyticus]